MFSNASENDSGHIFDLDKKIQLTFIFVIRLVDQGHVMTITIDKGVVTYLVSIFKVFIMITLN